MQRVKTRLLKRCASGVLAVAGLAMAVLGQFLTMTRLLSVGCAAMGVGCLGVVAFRRKQRQR